MVATLLSLMLVIGLVTVLQSAAIANTKTLKRMTRSHQEALDLGSARELARPYVAVVANAEFGDDGEKVMMVFGERFELSIRALDRQGLFETEIRPETTK